jgi:hypothetical protein
MVFEFFLSLKKKDGEYHHGDIFLFHAGVDGGKDC